MTKKHKNGDEVRNLTPDDDVQIDVTYRTSPPDVTGLVNDTFTVSKEFQTDDSEGYEQLKLKARIEQGQNVLVDLRDEQANLERQIDIHSLVLAHIDADRDSSLASLLQCARRDPERDDATAVLFCSADDRLRNLDIGAELLTVRTPEEFAVYRDADVLVEIEPDRPMLTYRNLEQEVRNQIEACIQHRREWLDAIEDRHAFSREVIQTNLSRDNASLWRLEDARAKNHLESLRDKREKVLRRVRDGRMN